MASSSISSSRTSSCTRSGSASGRSTLLIDDHRMQTQLESLPGDEPGLRHRAFEGVHQEQDAVHHRRIRSTSPPKSAWPGVSTMLIFTPPPPGASQRTEAFLEKMVMPRSLSSGLESITRSSIRCPSRNEPVWRSIWSTSVVLPWST